MWIPSKLTRPGRLHNAIVRPRVLDLLQQAPCYKLILFRSPAGYGKTTMAAQWLSDKNSVGWYSLMTVTMIRFDLLTILFRPSIAPQGGSMSELTNTG